LNPDFAFRSAEKFIFSHCLQLVLFRDFLLTLAKSHKKYQSEELIPPFTARCRITFLLLGAALVMCDIFSTRQIQLMGSRAALFTRFVTRSYIYLSSE